jgi:phosphoribosylaminoimidazole-succinocarboxamide synthase
MRPQYGAAGLRGIVPGTVSTVSRQTLQSVLPHVLEHTSLDQLGQRYQGKVRDNYTTADGRRIIVTTDRISAFDRILGTLPLKGQLLTACARWWFEHTREVAPNHLLSVPYRNYLYQHLGAL